MFWEAGRPGGGGGRDGSEAEAAMTRPGQVRARLAMTMTAPEGGEGGDCRGRSRVSLDAVGHKTLASNSSFSFKLYPLSGGQNQEPRLDLQ
jgi:hypothetical protein